MHRALRLQLGKNARFKGRASTADERALQECTCRTSSRVADEGVASTVSAPYSSLNGEFCGENRTLLVDILRDEWG
ncbi:MAG: hypothetical protein R2699_06010 [Acidimicrobiales bacterium]